MEIRIRENSIFDEAHSAPMIKTKLIPPDSVFSKERRKDEMKLLFAKAVSSSSENIPVTPA